MIWKLYDYFHVIKNDPLSCALKQEEKVAMATRAGCG